MSAVKEWEADLRYPDRSKGNPLSNRTKDGGGPVPSRDVAVKVEILKEVTPLLARAERGKENIPYSLRLS